MLALEDFIAAVTAESRIHVCIHDVSGITRHEPFCISASRRIHASRFCECAKALRGGLRLCMKCRALENARAERGEAFYGSCPFGVTEIAAPVFDGGRMLCVVYVGQLAADMDAVREKIIKTAALLKSPPDSVLDKLSCLQPCGNIKKYRLLAQAIAEYILLLYKTYGITPLTGGFHEAVTAAAEYAAAAYYRNISIEDVADRCGMNAKYLGRLFKEQTGESFNSYLNRVRVGHAKQLLAETAAPIIEIALECGYNNVTYFNRVFKKMQNISPRAYRKSRRGE